MKTNGTNGTHRNGHGALDPVAHATALASGQLALAEDAAHQLERAAQARVEAEKGLSEAEAAHREALRRSTALPGDEALLDELTRASSRMARARSLLGDLEEAHRTAEAREREARGRAQDAANAAERASLEVKVLDPARHARLEEMGGRVVKTLVGLHSLLDDMNRDLAQEHKLVTRARSLGSSLEYADGLPFARGAALAILEHGLDLGPAESHPIRWAFDLAPRARLASPIAKTINDVVALVVGAVARTPHALGATILRNSVETWRGARSHAAIARVEAGRAPEPASEARRLAEQAVASQPRPARQPDHGWSSTSQDLAPASSAPVVSSRPAAAPTRPADQEEHWEWEGDEDDGAHPDLESAP